MMDRLLTGTYNDTSEFARVTGVLEFCAEFEFVQVVSVTMVIRCSDNDMVRS